MVKNKIYAVAELWWIKGWSLEDTGKREAIIVAWRRSFQWHQWEKSG